LPQEQKQQHRQLQEQQRWNPECSFKTRETLFLPVLKAKAFVSNLYNGYFNKKAFSL